jgi:ATP-dependent DNA helicase RecQ
MIHILEVKIVKGRYMILIEIVDDQLRLVDDEFKAYIETVREVEWEFYNTSYNAIANAVRSNCKECISELFTDTYSKVYEFCAGCNAHKDSIVGDIPKFPLKNRVSEPLRSLSEEQTALFGDAQELVVIANKVDQEELINKLVEKGISLIIVPDKYKYSESLLNMKAKKNIMIVGLEEAFQLTSKRGFFFTSGLVAVIYPEDEKEIGQQYVVVKNNLCGKPSTKVIHIIEKNAYVAEAGKSFVELVDGPSLQPNVVYA